MVCLYIVYVKDKIGLTRMFAESPDKMKDAVEQAFSHGCALLDALFQSSIKKLFDSNIYFGNHVLLVFIVGIGSCGTDLGP